MQQVCFIGNEPSSRLLIAEIICCIFHQIAFRQGAAILDAIRQRRAILYGPAENVFPTKVGTLEFHAGG